MINATLRIAMLIAVAVYFVLLIYLLRKKSLNLKYTLLWIFAGALMLVLAVFPGVLDFFARLVGIHSPVNALFAVVCFCIIIILVSLTAIVSKLNEKVKRLIQYTALLENRMRKYEELDNVKAVSHNQAGDTNHG